MARDNPNAPTTSRKPSKTAPPPKSPWVRLTTSLYLPLSPCAHHFPLQGLLAEHISPLLLTYYNPFDGVVMAFENASLSEHPPPNSTIIPAPAADSVLSRSIDEYGVMYVWLTAEFTIFRPSRGVVLEGIVSVQNESVLGLVCYNFFNVGIDSDRLPKDWSWSGESFVDGKGEVVGGRVKFTVVDFEAESSGSSLQIKGSLVEG